MEAKEMGTKGSKRGMTGKFIILGGAIVVVVATVGYFGNMWPPHREDVAGTIGAAQRYRSEQIKSEDVVLDGADIQKFIQSDLFHRLINDPRSRKVLRSPEFQRLVGDPV